MDAATKGISDALLALGLPGIIILVLGAAVYKLATLYHDVQEKRITEGRETVKALFDTSSALDRLSELIRDRAKG